MTTDFNKTVSNWEDYFSVRSVIQNDDASIKLDVSERIIGVTHKTLLSAKGHVISVPVYVIGKARDAVIDELQRKLDVAGKMIKDQEALTREKENFGQMQLENKQKALKRVESMENEHADMKMNMIRYREELSNQKDYTDELLTVINKLKNSIGTIEFERIIETMPICKKYSPGSIAPKFDENIEKNFKTKFDKEIPVH